MAALSRKVLKYAVVFGSVPAAGIAVGYRMRAVQASENQSGESRIMRACDLPLYHTSKEVEKTLEREPYPRNMVEEQIGVVRKAVVGFLGGFKETYESVESKAQIGVEHTKASLDYVQNNPGELPRVIFIAIAGMGGIVLGYRGGIARKFIYSSIAVTSTAALCYPVKTMELSDLVTSEIAGFWEGLGGPSIWPFGESKETPQKENLEKEGDSAPSLLASDMAEQVAEEKQEQPQARAALAGDPGQSNPSDKDMYSTRSS